MKTLEFLKQNNIQMEAYSPLAKGSKELLSDKVLKEIGEKYNKTIAQVCIRWQIQRGVVTFPKSAHKERIRENFQVFDFELTQDDLTKIAQLERGLERGKVVKWQELKRHPHYPFNEPY